MQRFYGLFIHLYKWGGTTIESLLDWILLERERNVRITTNLNFIWDEKHNVIEMYTLTKKHGRYKCKLSNAFNVCQDYLFSLCFNFMNDTAFTVFLWIHFYGRLKNLLLFVTIILFIVYCYFKLNNSNKVSWYICMFKTFVFVSSI